MYVVWDVADDKYFRKGNDSDATQWEMLYPRIGAHSTSNPSAALTKRISEFCRFHLVWALLWIIFEIGILTGFVLLGLACFKLNAQQMYAQAGTSLFSTLLANADDKVVSPQRSSSRRDACTPKQEHKITNANDCTNRCTYNHLSSPFVQYPSHDTTPPPAQLRPREANEDRIKRKPRTHATHLLLKPTIRYFSWDYRVAASTCYVMLCIILYVSLSRTVSTASRSSQSTTSLLCWSKLFCVWSRMLLRNCQYTTPCAMGGRPRAP